MTEEQRAPAIVTADRPDVLVVGGGLVGLFCALTLRQRGLRVEVLETSVPGSGASQAAAGMLSPLAESLSDSDFAKACSAARDIWREWGPALSETSGVAIDYQETGSLFPVFDDRDEAFIGHLRSLAESSNEPTEELDAATLRREFPELSPEARHALRVPGEALVDPTKVIEALTQLLHRSGSLLHIERHVDSVTIGSESIRLGGPGWRTTVGQVVIAAGAWSGQLEGLPNWIHPVRGQMIAYRTPDWKLEGAIRLSEHYVLRRGDEILCGATVEEVDFDDTTTEEGRDQLTGTAQRLLPQLQWKSTTRHWAGLRPATPDGLPIVGRFKDSNLFFASGHFRNGILLAPWTAQAIASEVTEAQDSIQLPAFSPNRFES